MKFWPKIIGISWPKIIGILNKNHWDLEPKSLRFWPQSLRDFDSKLFWNVRNFEPKSWFRTDVYVIWTRNVRHFDWDFVMKVWGERNICNLRDKQIYIFIQERFEGKYKYNLSLLFVGKLNLFYSLDFRNSTKIITRSLSTSFRMKIICIYWQS